MIQRFDGPYHASHIIGLQWCERREYFKTVVNREAAFRSFPAMLGTAIHACIAAWHSDGRPELDSEEAEQWFRDALDVEENTPNHPDEAILPVFWPSDDRDKDIDEGVKEFAPMFLAYTQHPFALSRDFEILGQEIKWQMIVPPRPPYLFEGRIDQVRRNDSGQIVMVDLKSGSMDATVGQFSLDHSIQFLTYALALYRGAVLEDLRGQVPAIVQFNLRDLIPYQKRQARRNGEENWTDSYREWFQLHVQTGPQGGEYIEAGEHRGPGAHWSYPPETLLLSHEKLLRDYVQPFRIGRYRPHYSSTSCNYCAYREECRKLSDGELTEMDHVTKQAAKVLAASGVELAEIMD